MLCMSICVIQRLGLVFAASSCDVVIGSSQASGFTSESKSKSKKIQCGTLVCSVCLFHQLFCISYFVTFIIFEMWSLYHNYL